MFKALVKSVTPVGRDLNFDESSNELHVHNDVHTLLNIKKKIEEEEPRLTTDSSPNCWLGIAPLK
jgi:hypothetical protein